MSVWKRVCGDKRCWGCAAVNYLSIFLRWKLKSLREILKKMRTWSSLEIFATGSVAWQMNGRQWIQNGPTFSVQDLKIKQFNILQNHGRACFLNELNMLLILPLILKAMLERNMKVKTDIKYSWKQTSRIKSLP